MLDKQKIANIKISQTAQCQCVLNKCNDFDMTLKIAAVKINPRNIDAKQCFGCDYVQRGKGWGGIK